MKINICKNQCQKIRHNNYLFFCIFPLNSYAFNTLRHVYADLNFVFFGFGKYLASTAGHITSVLQKQVSRPGISNSIPRSMYDIITFSCPFHLLLAQHSWYISICIHVKTHVAPGIQCTRHILNQQVSNYHISLEGPIQYPVSLDRQIQGHWSSICYHQSKIFQINWRLYLNRVMVTVTRTVYSYFS